MDSLTVFPVYRHRGIGTALLGEARKRAKELGIAAVTLAVEPLNPAKMLYQQLGFGYDRPITIFNEVYHLYKVDTYEK